MNWLSCCEPKVHEDRFGIEKDVWFKLTGCEEWTPYASKTALLRKHSVDMNSLCEELAAQLRSFGPFHCEGNGLCVDTGVI